MNGAITRVGAKRCPDSTSAWSLLDDLLGPAPTVEPRTMFGYPCFAIAGKPFACVVDDAVALKLPPSEISRIDDPGICPFQLNEHPMAGWILIRRNSDDGFTRDEALVELALIANSEAAAGAPRP